MRRLTVLYDGGCPLCVRCVTWLRSQPAHVELELLDAAAPAAQARYGHLPWLGDQLVVVSDTGHGWAGPAAFVTCLWALVAWRPWASLAARPALAPVSARLFHGLSTHRRRLAAWLGWEVCASERCAIREPYR